MKHLIFLLLLFVAINALSQDLVVTKKGDSLKCLINQINSKQVYYTYKSQDGIQNVLTPIENIKSYQRNFYGLDSSFIESLTNVNAEIKEKENENSINNNAKTVKSGYYDLIVTKKGDSLNCKITGVFNDRIEYQFQKEDVWFSNKMLLQDIETHQFNFYRKDKAIQYSTFRVSFDGGWGYRTSKVAEVSSTYEDHAKKLRSGYTLGTEISGFVSKSIGVGLRYSFYKASNTDDVSIFNLPYNGLLTEKITISFIGPLLNARFTDTNSSDNFIIGAGLGYLVYKNEMTLSEKIVLKGKTVGLNLNLAYERPLNKSKSTFIKFQASIVSGTLNKIDVEAETSKQTVELPGDGREGLTRIDFSIGFTFTN